MNVGETLKNTRKGQQGFSVVEVLVAISLLAISGLAVAQTTIRAFAHLNQSLRTSLASQIALERVEDLAQRDPADLQTTATESRSLVSVSGLEFYRSTIVTVNPDGSRNVTVSVSSPQGMPGRSTLTTTFPLRGNS